MLVLHYKMAHRGRRDTPGDRCEGSNIPRGHVTAQMEVCEAATAETPRF